MNLRDEMTRSQSQSCNRYRQPAGPVRFGWVRFGPVDDIQPVGKPAGKTAKLKPAPVDFSRRKMPYPPTAIWFLLVLVVQKKVVYWLSKMCFSIAFNTDGHMKHNGSHQWERKRGQRARLTKKTRSKLISQHTMSFIGSQRRSLFNIFIEGFIWELFHYTLRPLGVEL